MPAYAYPITINRERQTVRFMETKEIDSDVLKLSDLEFVGNDSFDVEEILGGYSITVFRSRLETNEEMNSRIKKEESYMVEYHKRHPKKLNS